MTKWDEKLGKIIFSQKKTKRQIHGSTKFYHGEIKKQNQMKKSVCKMRENIRNSKTKLIY